MSSHWLRSVRNRLVKFSCFALLVSFTYMTSYTNFLDVIHVIHVVPANRTTRHEDIPKNISREHEKNKENKGSIGIDNKGRTKYILLWTNAKESPFVYFGTGRSIFITKKCKFNKCFVTEDRNYLGLFQTEFDAILFNGPRLNVLRTINDMPTRRSSHQKYVFANIESSANYPVHTNFWNGFFNWTWTYRLDSDSLWGYMAIRNSSNDIVGPSSDMHWLSLSDMQSVDLELKQSLKTKERAAAWFSSNCLTLGRREDFVKEIDMELRYYGLNVDIYGSCGEHICPRSEMDRCLELLQKKYYFYFAFENSLSEDYVTEKIVYALNHNTVPVVYGGANYSRFMPDGIYLDAMKLGPKKLAKTINNLINNPAKYYDFFKWKKHYSYHFRSASPDTDDYCRFCQVLHDPELIETETVYNNFQDWWSTNLSYTSIYRDNDC